jgi:hypothetical protein
MNLKCVYPWFPNFSSIHLTSPIFSHLQGPTVQGEVSLTCDAWQAGNTDAYFAVTAHWTRESTPTKWELKSAIIGFTRLNNAHNGVRLGQALFKVIKRVGLENKVSSCHHTLHVPALTLACSRARPCPRLPMRPRPHPPLRPPSPLPALAPTLALTMSTLALTIVVTLAATMKVGHVTCDNAANNSTMMKEFAARLKITTGRKYIWKKRKIKFVYSSLSSLLPSLMNCSCLAHVINLATQKLISSYSKSPHFDPIKPDAHVPTTRDEVGLVRAIVVKVRSFIWLINDIAHRYLGTFICQAERNVEENTNAGE